MAYPFSSNKQQKSHELISNTGYAQGGSVAAMLAETPPSSLCSDGMSDLYDDWRDGDDGADADSVVSLSHPASVSDSESSSISVSFFAKSVIPKAGSENTPGLVVGALETQGHLELHEFSHDQGWVTVRTPSASPAVTPAAARPSPAAMSSPSLPGMSPPLVSDGSAGVPSAPSQGAASAASFVSPAEQTPSVVAPRAPMPSTSSSMGPPGISTDLPVWRMTQMLGTCTLAEVLRGVVRMCHRMGGECPGWVG